MARVYIARRLLACYTLRKHLIHLEKLQALVISAFSVRSEQFLTYYLYQRGSSLPLSVVHAVRFFYLVSPVQAHGGIYL